MDRAATPPRAPLRTDAIGDLIASITSAVRAGDDAEVDRLDATLQILERMALNFPAAPGPLTLGTGPAAPR